MSRARVDLYRRKLASVLGYANDEDFLLMCWSCDALQSGRASEARPYIFYPKEAVTEDLTSPYAVHRWRIETLINELFATPKPHSRAGERVRYLKCKEFGAMSLSMNALSKYENAYDGQVLKRINVLQEMHRLIQRQFDWQNGYINKPQFYRAAFLYGGERSRAAFENKYECTISDYIWACFALIAIFSTQPLVSKTLDLQGVNVSQKTLALVFSKISIDLEEARSYTARIRAGYGHPSYKRSILRQFPLIGISKNRIICPLLELLAARMSSGIFYDVIGLGADIRNEISDRFEQYCFDLIQIALGGFAVERSWKYRPIGKKDIDTPDIIVSDNEKVSVIVECKATRMSYEARFSEDPIASAARGYGELVKGVFQIWRFASHLRRGLVPGRERSKDISGMVLTLDTWLSMVEPMQQNVLEQANAMADEKDPSITFEDRIHVQFVPCNDLEFAYQTQSQNSLFEAIKGAIGKKYEGYLLSAVHREMFPNAVDVNAYPFGDRIVDLLPWWGELEVRRKHRKDGGASLG